ncbi:hypothetical protein BV20DRAFT_205195 [Pilatotrama ljubarskyi]|nr:hypothetical protein BV20DRAFT_205195 [Pilatotrama ljubarskyi]
MLTSPSMPGFYEVSLSQMYYYYTRYPHDPLHLKALLYAARIPYTRSSSRIPVHCGHSFIRSGLALD